jgi:hypothetical protein
VEIATSLAAEIRGRPGADKVPPAHLREHREPRYCFRRVERGFSIALSHRPLPRRGSVSTLELSRRWTRARRPALESDRRRQMYSIDERLVNHAAYVGAEGKRPFAIQLTTLRLTRLGPTRPRVRLSRDGAPRGRKNVRASTLGVSPADERPGHRVRRHSQLDDERTFALRTFANFLLLVGPKNSNAPRSSYLPRRPSPSLNSKPGLGY